MNNYALSPAGHVLILSFAALDGKRDETTWFGDGVSEWLALGREFRKDTVGFWEASLGVDEEDDVDEA